MWYLRPWQSSSPTCKSIGYSPGRSTLRRIQLFLLFARLTTMQSFAYFCLSLSPIIMSTNPTCTLPPYHRPHSHAMACLRVSSTPIEASAESAGKIYPIKGYLRLCLRCWSSGGREILGMTANKVFLPLPEANPSRNASTYFSLLSVTSCGNGSPRVFLSLLAGLMVLSDFLKASPSQGRFLTRISQRVCAKVA